jgi:pyridoxal phosphate enzyme (YggS family)
MPAQFPGAFDSKASAGGADSMRGTSKLAANLAQVREAISDSAVRLIAVTKNATNEQIEEAFELGLSDFGESRLQDALKKRDTLPPLVASQCNWHFIGHLQSNKVKHAVGNFSLIHSVDSIELAREISRIATQKGQTQAILLQVKVVPDDAKSGFTPQSLREAMAEIVALPSIKVEGLMTITPLTDDHNVWKQSFNGLAMLRDELSKTYGPLKELSMGMSDDWREAITCGSTMIRLGRALFSN